MKPIRILQMMSSLDIGGSQAFVMNLYRNIDRESIQFDFIIDHPEQTYFQAEIEKLGGKVYVLPSFRGTNIKELKKAWNKFFLEHPEYRVLHSHSRSYASIYIPIAKKYGIKTIIHSHSTSNGKGIGAVVKAFLQYPLRYQADYFMACSYEAGEWLFGRKVCKNANFQIVKNDFDSQKYIYNKEIRQQARQELGLGEAFVLGYLARVTEPKNPLYAIEVFYALREMLPDAKLLFVGDGSLMQKVRDKAAEYGILDSIVFTGSRPDVERMLFAMDCYILPSLWEGLGISLIEAQASGLPCICSENIPDEAIITDLVMQTSLAERAEHWATKILEKTKIFERMDQSERIKKAGYDIHENVNKITAFYQNILD